MSINKSVVVSIVGSPNVGKSTLTNALVGTKVAIVSAKPQTTRTRITGILNKDECQFIFLDTPGLHKPKSSLGDFMVKIVNETVPDTDIAALVVEPTAIISEAEEQIIKKVEQFGIPCILIINKIDTIEKSKILEVIVAYSNRYNFEAIIPVSAKSHDGVNVVLDEFKKFALEGPALFPEDMESDQPERQIIAETIREKALNSLEKEIPHGLAVEIIKAETGENGVFNISANIYCEKASHKGIIIGHKGAKLRKIGSEARLDLEKKYECKVFLELWVKVKEDWRNNMYQMRNFGYTEQ